MTFVVEDTIQAAVQNATIAIKVLAFTTGEMKEFIFYIPRGVDIKTLHEGLQATISTHDVQCIAEDEVNWPTYRGYRQIVEMSTS